MLAIEVSKLHSDCVTHVHKRLTKFTPTLDLGLLKHTALYHKPTPASNSLCKLTVVSASLKDSRWVLSLSVMAMSDEFWMPGSGYRDSLVTDASRKRCTEKWNSGGSLLTHNGLWLVSAYNIATWHPQAGQWDTKWADICRTTSTLPLSPTLLLYPTSHTESWQSGCVLSIK